MKYFYPKNRHTYEVLNKVKMKDPSTGEWKEGYLYTQITDQGLHYGMYVREKQDFLKKFQGIN